jgi:hypothetical protein
MHGHQKVAGSIPAARTFSAHTSLLFGESRPAITGANLWSTDFTTPMLMGNQKAVLSCMSTFRWLLIPALKN